MAPMGEVTVSYEGPEGAEQVTEVHADDWLPPRTVDRGGGRFVRRRYTAPTPEEAEAGLTARSATYVYRGPAPEVPEPPRARVRGIKAADGSNDSS